MGERVQQVKHVFGNKVLCLAEELVSKNAGLIIVSQTGDGVKLERGTVLEVGPLCEEVFVGDFVVWGRYAPVDIEIGGEKYVLIREEDIHLTLEREGE